ncbi:MFS transporter [Aeromicrobium sp. CF3.5]|uniref:MFS transporter n=1 Tax=Aeromicrobium sp. CF3.5 TaxID=3373078 RepID=UPI003EE5604C
MTLPTATTSPGTGRTAYVALLALSTLGTLSSTIMTAPINEIARSLDATPSQIVVAVSAFTLAMVLASPLAGWTCERFGTKRVLLAALVLMVVAQLGASTSGSLVELVAWRALQGIACSAIPPAVQQTLARHWAHRRAQAMAAWASAIGVGQALGPPLGGAVADLLGWRAVFATHAALSIVLFVLVVWRVPTVRAGRPPMHVTGMTTLVVGVGALVVSFTWAGQGGSAVVGASLVGVGVAALVAHAVLALRSPRAFVPARLLIERRYRRSTAAAATSMACLGVVIVSTPLHLGRDWGLGPGAIGATTLALAAAITVFAPWSARLGRRWSPRSVLGGSLGVLATGMLLLAAVGSHEYRAVVLAGTVVVLALTGAAIGIVQAGSALGVMRSDAASGTSSGAALGIHNMMRFSGLAAGYAWVATTWPTGSLWWVYGGPVVLVGATLMVLAGPPAAPTEDATSTAGLTR